MSGQLEFAGQLAGLAFLESSTLVGDPASKNKPRWHQTSDAQGYLLISIHVHIHLHRHLYKHKHSHTKKIPKQKGNMKDTNLNTHTKEEQHSNTTWVY